MAWLLSGTLLSRILGRETLVGQVFSPGLDIFNEIYIIYGMWKILEHRKVPKDLATAPVEVQKRYQKWKDIVSISGPQGLKEIRGFRDEALSGKWKGFRASRLNTQYRVIYQVQKVQVLVKVEKVTPHDYRRT